MGILQTEYEFTLPRGYVDAEGNLHRKVLMRLATAEDEIRPKKDPRVRNNEHFFDVIFIARVVTKLGSLPRVNTDIISKLFLEDFHFLKAKAVEINQPGSPMENQEESPGWDHIYKEITYLAYFLHWDYQTLIHMDHRERQKWVGEVSDLHARMNQSQGKKEKSILEM
ncbi:DUF6760 family protein [Candidatus Uabimicrobium sp. HlEnr_7]|uniref:DUF6760 family protein n=1 Tax=Candidatus Uabimicrobium helgolandensis TaxID=3095367 RepID=UPI003556D8ED